MPLPCPLFDYWHRHALVIAIVAAFLSAAIAWLCITGTPAPPVCEPNIIKQPPHPTPMIIHHCQAKQWMRMATQLGLIDMNYQGQDKPSLELHGSFQQCMDLTAWFEQNHVPLQRLSLKRSTLRQQQHRRIITCLFTFHCP